MTNLFKQLIFIYINQYKETVPQGKKNISNKNEKKLQKVKEAKKEA